MANLFRVYHKKRGNRRTGSQKLGSLGEALFFATFFLLGCAGLALVLSTLLIPQWKANHEFVARRCLILDKRIGRKVAEGVPLYRPEVQIEYEVGGETYRNWTYDVRGEYVPDKAAVEKSLARFRPDPSRKVDCWYDPSDPNVAVLVRRIDWWPWLMLIVPVSFLLIGGGGLIYRLFTWGKSAERRADLTRRAGNLGPFETGGGSKVAFPHVPEATNITNSPGTNLAFRLPAAATSAWTLVVTLAACLLWNGIVCVFAVGAVRGHLRGDPDWFLTLFLVPFMAVGIGLIVYLVRQLVVTTAIGPTLVEISDQPLKPAGRYRVFLCQTGRLKLNSLQIILACDEEATFRHGTNTRTETRRVYEQCIYSRQSFETRPGLPFETKCDIEVPAGAMHSFKSEHNEVNWKLLVRGEAAGRPSYERSFPLVVCPSENGHHKS